MTKIHATAYLVLTPTERNYRANERGVRPVTAFKVDRLTQNRPVTKQSQIATKVNITIDSTLFDKIAPVIDIELEEGEIFANVATQVAINAEGDTPE
jgi:hypothetical protein